MTTPKDARPQYGTTMVSWTATCGCTVDSYQIIYCPTHAAAPRMKELLHDAVTLIVWLREHPSPVDAVHQFLWESTHIRDEGRALLRELGQ